MIIQDSLIIGIDNQKTSSKCNEYGCKTLYRILMYKYDDTNGKWAFNKAEVPEEAVVKAINAGKISIKNAQVNAGKLVGVTGMLERFTKGAEIGHRPFVILSELRASNTGKLLGYRIATYDFKVRSIKLSDMLSACARINNRMRDARADGVPIQNAMYIEATEGIAAHIKGYRENQFIVEKLTVNTPSNTAPAKVNMNDNNRKLEKLNELFTKEQIHELKLGKEHGVNIRVYGNNKLSAAQMKELRKALEDGINPSQFADPAFKPDTMRAYRFELKYGRDISSFINPEYNKEQIAELSTALLSGVNIAKLADPSKSAIQMAKERIEMESEIWKESDVSVVAIIKEFEAKDKK